MPALQQSGASGLPQQPEGALLQEQLGYFQTWLVSLSRTPLQAVALQSVQSAVRVVVSGFSDTTSAEDLRNTFEGLMAAHHAAVAPGKAVQGANIQPGSPASAVLQLRCSVEASNCLAFDGLACNGAVLKVARPLDYNPEAAVLLGPTQPNPAVCAAVARATAASITANGDACSHAVGSSSAAATRSGPLPAATGRSSAAGGPASAGPGKGGPRDLLLPADQSKQDEVFIGGLPSNWKAQQLKELLQPYGQLKSLTVAMDAATGKNKGYAFVVFASPDMVSHAIEELDCRVVEGKILAVQRATEGKACYGRESSGGGGSDTGGLRDGGFVGGSQHQHQPGPVVVPQPHQQQPAPAAQQHQHHPPPLLRHHHHRSSSTGSALPPHLPAPTQQLQQLSAGAGGAESGPLPSSLPSAFASHCRISSAGAPAGPTSMGPAPPPAPPAAPPADSSVLGPRPPPAGPLGSSAASGSSGGGSMQHSSGPSSAKQYDINELYIGDLPLTWDEDAVRRLLGRFGRIKYFTLRNGRDKNFAFCKFKDSSVVDAAIAGLHGKIVDGYFLNVRRAIEGKQQNTLGASPQTTQQQWPGAKQPPMHQQQQQQPNMRASFDATSTRANALTHRPRMSADQQQLSKLAAAATAVGPPLLPAGPGASKGPGLLGHPFAGSQGPRSNVLGSGGAAGHQQDRMAGGRGEQQQQHRDAVRGQQLLQREHDRARAGSPAAGGPVAAAGGVNGLVKQQEAASGGSTASSTPGTPTVELGAEQQQQQQQAAAHAGPTAMTTALPAPGPGTTAVGALGYGPFLGPQLLHRPTLQQQQLHHQQQQQQSMFNTQAAAYAAAAGLLPPGPLPPPAQPGGGGASLFGPNGPASWPGAASLAAVAAAAAAASPATAAGNLALADGGAGGGFGLGLGLKQQQQPEGVLHGPATQAQSLLQTWDMLAPWSLFSHTSQ